MATQLEKSRIKDRVPTELLDEILYKRDYSKEMKEHLNFIKQLKEYPVKVYSNLKRRLELNGQNASFPEFIGVVGYIIKELFQNKTNQDIIKKDFALSKLIEEYKFTLMSILIENRYFFPYRITIEVIEQGLHFLDVIARIKNPNLPNYYHTVRYHTYFYYLLELEPNGIVIPTFAELDVLFFIQTRCVPIYVLGITSTPLYVDMYTNTPLEFFIHDVGHSRRLHQEMERYYDVFIRNKKYESQRSPFNLTSREDFYNEQYHYTKTLLNIINHTKDKQRANLKKLILFEVLHEQSSPVTKNEICRRIQMSYDRFPVEKFRESKDHFIKMVFSPSADPTTLSHMYHKLVHGFYDSPKDPMESLLKAEYRTVEKIADVAVELINDLNCKQKSSTHTLKKLITNTKYANEYLTKPKLKIRKTLKKRKS
jgi:hypothetical protein